MKSVQRRSKQFRVEADIRYIATVNFSVLMSSTLMIHPTLPDRRVKLGFNWSALLFGTVWAYAEGLTAHGGRMAAMDAFACLLLTVDDSILAAAAMLLYVAKNIYCARHVGSWVQKRLLIQGYRAL